MSDKYACIDDLIGEKLKAAGIRCPCAKHSPSGSEPPEPNKGPKQEKPDFKKQAAGDTDD
jgi:hypothetical protein